MGMCQTCEHWKPGDSCGFPVPDYPGCIHWRKRPPAELTEARETIARQRAMLDEAHKRLFCMTDLWMRTERPIIEMLPPDSDYSDIGEILRRVGLVTVEPTGTANHLLLKFATASAAFSFWRTMTEGDA